MVEWIVSSSVLIAVVILLRFVLKGKISLRLQYALWALVLVRLLVPISFGDTAMSVGNLTQKAAASETAQFVSALSETELPRMTYQAAYNEVAKEYADRGIQIEDMPLEEYAETVDYEIMNKMNGNLSIAEVVKIIWICGIALVGVWFLLSNLRLHLSLKRTRTLLTDSHALPVYLSDAIDTPCLFGLFHPAIYLTGEAIESEHTQRHAVEHELTHFRHKDNIWAILRSVCLAVHWYNPLVWCAAVLSRNDAELACDESTILRLGEEERASYGRTLIHLTCEKRPALLNTATTMTGSGKSIKERISLIVKKPKMAGYTLAVVILITVFAVGCTFTGASKPSETPDESGPTSTGQYASMEDFAAAAMEKTTTVTYYTLYDPNTDPSTPREATAYVQDTKIAWLEKKGEVSGLAPEGTLEAWTFNYLVKIDADPTTVSLVGGMYEEDGWFDLEGQGGHNIVALRYEDGSYDILYDAPVNDNYDFYGLRNSYEEAIYDWYVKKNNLDLPLYVKDWSDIITVPEGESLGDFPVRRYDGDGWYIYIPVQTWTAPVRNSAGNYEIYSQYNTGSSIIISKSSDSEEQVLNGYLAAGYEVTEVGPVKNDSVETDCVFTYPALDGGCYVLHAIWYNESITDYPYITMEPYVMRLIAESFTVLDRTEDTTQVQTQASFTPATAIYELFDAAGDMTVTLHLANEGACNAYTVTDRWYAERFEVLMMSYEWTEIEMPGTVPSEYWLTAESSNGLNKMTFWSGDAGMIQYDNGSTTTYWLATPLYESSDSIAYSIRRDYDNLDVDHSRIKFYLSGNAEKAASSFVHTAFGSHLLSLMPGNWYSITEYEVVDWDVREISEDGTAVVGWFEYAFIPEDMQSPGIWAGNTDNGTGEYEGMLTAYREFVLQKQDDGYWHCIGLGTGGYTLPE